MGSVFNVRFNFLVNWLPSIRYFLALLYKLKYRFIHA